MMEIKYQDEKFLAKGTFSIGIAGVYENKDFGEGNIEINIELEDILEDLQKGNSSLYEPLFPYLKDKGEAGAAIAKGIADYYNQKEREIKENVKQINDYILYRLFDNLEDCGYPFWEIEEAVLPGSLDGYDMDHLTEEIYSAEESIGSWGFNLFAEQPNNGTVAKPDLESRLRKQYPMFNFDGLYESMEQDCLYLSGRFMSFQFSDGWGAQLLCAAYDEFDENLASCDWHNH
ncbi:hypothetical protein IMSAGC011_01074 [Lachnospiraceae bacterium]|nr:hypothetical protein IMSAGC011_01074 [Lachnospiraceae bacterium]